MVDESTILAHRFDYDRLRGDPGACIRACIAARKPWNPSKLPGKVRLHPPPVDMRVRGSSPADEELVLRALETQNTLGDLKGAERPGRTGAKANQSVKPLWKGLWSSSS
jgi:hypothetical protein